MVTLGSVQCRLKDCERLMVSFLAGGGFVARGWQCRITEHQEPCRSSYGEEFTRVSVGLCGVCPLPKYWSWPRGEMAVDLFFKKGRGVLVAVEGVARACTDYNTLLFEGRTPIIIEGDNQ